MSKSKFIAVGEAVFRALFDPLVVVTEMTACSLIVAVLALAWPDVNKKVFVLCIVIALAGLVTIVSQMRAIYRRERRNAIIDDLYTEGHRLVQNLGAGTQQARWKTFPTEPFEIKSSTT